MASNNPNDLTKDFYQNMNSSQVTNGPIGDWFGNTWFRSLAGMIPTAISDYFGNKFYQQAQDRAYAKYKQRMKDVTDVASTFNQQGTPQANLSSFWNAGGDVGANVPRAYERALSQVRPTADSVYAASQSMNLAGQTLGAADAATRMANAQAATALQGLRRQAMQAAGRSGSANALRDIIGETAQRGVAASQNAAEIGAQAYGRNAQIAGQLMAQAPQLTQQSQLAQYQLFAKPREAQLSPYAAATAQQILNNGVPYDMARPDYQGLQQYLYAIGAKQLTQALLGTPPRLRGEADIWG